MLIAMAVWDTTDNGRTWMTRATLESLLKTVNFGRHRLIISDNGSCSETRHLYREYPFKVIYNGKNLGTANAINKAWRLRQPGEHAVKMDNDVVIHQPGWADWMEDVFARDPTIGICGLKRKDLSENPFDGTSKIRMIPHERGQRWIVVEEVQHVIGTCQAYSSALLDKIGYLVQPGLYGFDDSLSAVRAEVAGFKSAFLCGFEIDHVDPGGDAFCDWKSKYAAQHMDAYWQMVCQYRSGERDVYHAG